MLDQNGKPSLSLTYGKLLSRSHKIAYNLLNKVGPKGDPGVKPGDRVSVLKVTKPFKRDKFVQTFFVTINDEKDSFVLKCEMDDL